MKAKDISLGGILTAISLVVLYFSSIMPINKLSILTLASCIIPIAIINSSVKVATFVYLSASILGIFFVQPNLIISYILFFGIYAIIKHYIEKMMNITKEIIAKLIFFNISLAAIFLIINLFLGGINLSFSPIIIFIGAQVAFLIYDYALTLVITFYLNRIKR